MAGSGDSTLHQSQTLESVGQGSRSLAGGTGRGLSAHDLRGEPGSDCAPPTRWRESTKSFGGGPKPKLHCLIKRRFCCCCSACCAAVKSSCAAWLVGRI